MSRKLTSNSLKEFDLREVLQNKLRPTREAMPEPLQVRSGLATTPEGKIVYTPARYIPKSGWMAIFEHCFNEDSYITEECGTPTFKEISLGVNRVTEAIYSIEISANGKSVRSTGTYQIQRGDDLERAINIASGNALSRGMKMLGIGNDIPWDEVALEAPKFIVSGDELNPVLSPYDGEFLAGGVRYSNSGEILGAAPIFDVSDEELKISSAVLAKGAVPNDEKDIIGEGLVTEVKVEAQVQSKETPAADPKEEKPKKARSKKAKAPETEESIHASVMEALFGTAPVPASSNEPKDEVHEEEPIPEAAVEDPSMDEPTIESVEEKEPEPVMDSEPVMEPEPETEVQDPEVVDIPEVPAIEVEEEKEVIETPSKDVEAAENVIFSVLEGASAGNMEIFIGMPMKDVNEDIVNMLANPSYKEAAKVRFPQEVLDAACVLAGR